MITLKRVGPLYLLESENILPDLLVFLDSKCSYFKREFNIFSGKTTLTKSNLYRVVDGKICIPRGLLPSIVNFCKEKNIGYSIENQLLLNGTGQFLHKYDFRPTQKECIEAIRACAQCGLGGAIEAPPAYGKSYLLSAICDVFPDIKIDIISKRRDVSFGNYRTLKRYHNDVGLITGGIKEENRITVYTIGSIHHSDFKARLVLLDEVHELVTDNYFEKLMNYFDCLMFGFTATLDTRFDNLHKRIGALCGPTIFKIEYNEAENFDMVVPIVVHWYKIKLDRNPISMMRQFVDVKRYGIWKNHERNEKIAKIAKEYYDVGLQVLVLTETIEHVLELHHYLPEFEICYSNSPRETFGFDDYKRIPESERENLRQKFQNREIMGMIATGIWSVGVSFDSLEVVIRADGSASMTSSIQAPGRVARISPDTNKDHGIVVDFLDSFDDRLAKKSNKRAAVYRKKGWTQVNKD